MRGYSQLGEDWGAGSSRTTASRELIFAPPRDLMFSGSFEMVYLGRIIQNTGLILARCWMLGGFLRYSDYTCSFVFE